MKKTNRFWHCIIGTTSFDNIPDGGDLPMRIAVEKAYKKLIGNDADILSSGWGLTEERRRIIEVISNLERDSEPLEKIKEILQPFLSNKLYHN